MNAQFQRPSQKLISLGLASASVLLSFPAFALVNQPHNHQANSTEFNQENRELLAQGGSGDAGDEGLNNEELPSIDITNDEQPQLQPNTNQDPTTVPTGENNQTNSPSTPSGETNGNEQHSTSSDRLRPGSWLCANNPNPACDS